MYTYVATHSKIIPKEILYQIDKKVRTKFIFKYYQVGRYLSRFFCEFIGINFFTYIDIFAEYIKIDNFLFRKSNSYFKSYTSSCSFATSFFNGSYSTFLVPLAKWNKTFGILQIRIKYIEIIISRTYYFITILHYKFNFDFYKIGKSTVV